MGGAIKGMASKAKDKKGGGGGGGSKSTIGTSAYRDYGLSAYRDFSGNPLHYQTHTKNKADKSVKTSHSGKKIHHGK